MSPLPIHRVFVGLTPGQIHYAECGDAHAPTVLLLHQTPRSWREYEHVLPLLGARCRAIAMDTAGFGDSAPGLWPVSIERWAGVAAELLDALGIAQANVVGHHTGGVIALELAAGWPDKVARLVLSSTPYTGAVFRAARAVRPPIDHVEPSTDGSHLMALWQKRQAFYPHDRPDLLQAFVADALKTAGDVEAGHRAVASYRMEDRIGRVRARTLLIRAPDDPFAAPHAAEMITHLPRVTDARVVDITGGGVPLPDQLPQAFAQAVLGFVA